MANVYSIKNSVLYPMLAVSANMKYIKELNSTHAEELNKFEGFDVFGLFLLNGLHAYLDDFKTFGNSTLKEGTVITGRLNMSETMRRQTLSRNRVCFSVNCKNYNKELIGVIKHTISFIYKYVSDFHIRHGLHDYLMLLDNYRSIRYAIPRIVSLMRQQSMIGVKALLNVCIIIRRQIEYELSNKDGRGDSINNSQTLGYIFENYVKYVVADFVSKSKKNTDENSIYNTGVSCGSTSDGIHKYDFHFYNKDIDCVGEVKYTSDYVKRAFTSELGDFIGARYISNSYDDKAPKSTLGILIHAKSTKGEKEIKDVKFDVLQRRLRGSHLYRINLKIDLGVDSITVVYNDLIDKLQRTLNSVHFLEKELSKNEVEI